MSALLVTLYPALSLQLHSVCSRISSHPQGMPFSISAYYSAFPDQIWTAANSSWEKEASTPHIFVTPIYVFENNFTQRPANHCIQIYLPSALSVLRLLLLLVPSQTTDGLFHFFVQRESP